MENKVSSSTDKEIQREVTVRNRLGIHARPASIFVRVAAQFECDIFVEKDNQPVNGKSVMGLMSLAAGQGSKIRIIARGPDAERAVEALANLVERDRFFEE